MLRDQHLDINCAKDFWHLTEKTKRAVVFILSPPRHNCADNEQCRFP